MLTEDALLYLAFINQRGNVDGGSPILTRYRDLWATQRRTGRWVAKRRCCGGIPLEVRCIFANMDRLLAAVSAGYNGELVMIDSTCMRVHQNGATGKKGEAAIAVWDVPAVASPANAMLLSMLTDALSA